VTRNRFLTPCLVLAAGVSTKHMTMKKFTTLITFVLLYLSTFSQTDSFIANGVTTEYDKNGKIISQIWRKDSLIIREKRNYPDSLLNQKRKFIKAKVVQSDTSIINNTNLIVEELYNKANMMEVVLSDSVTIPFDFISEIGFYKHEKNNYIGVQNEIFIIKPDGLENCESCINFDSNDALKTINYFTNVKVVKKTNGEYDISYPEKDVKYNLSIGNLIVHVRRLMCDDTGNNPLTLINNGKSIELRNIHNLMAFEYDSNKDGLNELYIVSYESCQATYRILRIRKK